MGRSATATLVCEMTVLVDPLPGDCGCEAGVGVTGARKGVPGDCGWCGDGGGEGGAVSTELRFPE